MWALIGGLVAVLVGVLLMVPAGWAKMTWHFIAGGIVVLLILGGLVAIASGISDMKDRIAEKKEEEKEKEAAGKAPAPETAGADKAADKDKDKDKAADKDKDKKEEKKAA